MRQVVTLALIHGKPCNDRERKKNKREKCSRNAEGNENETAGGT